MGRAHGREDRARSPSTRCAHELPVVWLVDSAGARITDQVELFPGRRGAGRIFVNQVRLSGKVPQVCCLFGPSAAGGAYIPAFCDVVFMVEGNASMYLGSPRMAEMVIGETRHARGDGRRPHARHRVAAAATTCAVDDDDAIDQAKRGSSRTSRRTWREAPPGYRAPTPPARRSTARRRARRGAARRTTCTRCIDALVDAGSFFELKPLWAPELIIGLRAPRRPAGRHRRQQPDAPRRRAVRRLRRQGGPLHLAVRRVQRAAGVPRRRARLHDRHRRSSAQGIIRHGAKMITAVAEATVPEVLGDRAQGVRRRALRDVRPGVRSRRHASRCRPRRSR